MATLEIWVTVMHGAADTVAKDFQRARKIFQGVPLSFNITKHVLSKAQTKSILGTDGKLAVAGGPTEFDHDLPAGAASRVPRPMTVTDKHGRFTTEVAAAVRDWSDLGGLHVFYVPDLDPPSSEGGICLTVGDLIDPIIFVSQAANVPLVAQTKNRRGVLEHEIGHAFGLGHRVQAKTLMLDVLSSSGVDAGTELSEDEIKKIRGSRLFGLAAARDKK